MSDHKNCPHCRRRVPDLLVTPSSNTQFMCSGAHSRECLVWTAAFWQKQFRYWKNLFAESAASNVNFVNQNCLLIQRNTHMETILNKLGIAYPTKDSLEPPLAPTVK